MPPILRPSPGFFKVNSSQKDFRDFAAPGGRVLDIAAFCPPMKDIFRRREILDAPSVPLWRTIVFVILLNGAGIAKIFHCCFFSYCCNMMEICYNEVITQDQTKWEDTSFMNMKKSIKKTVWTRAIAALASILLFSFVTTANTDEEAREFLTLMGAPFTR